MGEKREWERRRIRYGVGERREWQSVWEWGEVEEEIDEEEEGEGGEGEV